MIFEKKTRHFQLVFAILVANKICNYFSFNFVIEVIKKNYKWMEKKVNKILVHILTHHIHIVACN
jgi:hypothetical protein